MPEMIIPYLNRLVVNSKQLLEKNQAFTSTPDRLAKLINQALPKGG